MIFLASFRLAGLEPIVETVRNYDSVSNPLEDWCSQKREAYEQLPPLEVTEEQLVQQKEETLAIKEDVSTQENAVEKLQEYAEQFLRDTEVCSVLSNLQPFLTADLYVNNSVHLFP